MLNWDWAFWTAGATLALTGLLLCAWSLLHDRPRGRRRCPKCWYDMSAVPGLKCPECGRTARAEHRFFRTRRRWRWAALGAALLACGAGTAALPAAKDGRWVQYAPPSLLEFALSHFDERAEKEYQALLAAGIPSQRSSRLPAGVALSFTSTPPAAVSQLSRWQRLLVARACGVHLETDKASRPNAPFFIPAVSILKALGDDARPAVPVVKRLLASGNEDRRNLANWVLRDASPSCASSVVRSLLRSPDIEPRLTALDALARGVPGNGAVVTRVAALARRSNDIRVRARSMEALSAIGDDATIVAVGAAALKDREDSVRVAAARMIAGEKSAGAADPADFPALAGFVPPTVYSPVNLGARPALSADRAALLVRALGDRVMQVRLVAAQTLRERAGPLAPRFARDLAAAANREPDAAVRFELVRAAGSAMPESERAAWSVKWIPDESTRVTSWAIGALKRSGEAPAGAPALLLQVARRNDAETSGPAIDALRWLGEDGVAPLAELLADQHSGIRVLAASTLADIPDLACGVADAVPALLDDEMEYARLAAVRILRHCPAVGRSWAAKLLEMMRSDPSAPVRTESVTAVGALGPELPGFPPALIAALDDEVEGVRFNSAIELQRLGPARGSLGIARLQAALQDKSASVQRAAAAALQAVTSPGAPDPAGSNSHPVR